MNPKVSIIIPVYNGANYMREAIESALKQTYKNCEVIVINDGSEDHGETDSIARSYGDRIRYYKKENGGVATAVNLGIQKMTGEYFAWLSHDDMFYPTKIQEQMEALAQSGNLDKIVFGNFEFLNADSGEKRIFRIENLCDNTKLTNGIYPILFGLVHFCTVLVPKKRVDEVGLCNEHLKTTQDIEWIFRLFRKEETIFIKKPLTVVRNHQSQGKYWIKEYNSEQGKTHIEFLESISTDEIEAFFGDSFTMYEKMATFYRQDKNLVAFEYARQAFNKLPKPKDVFNQISEFRSKMQELSKGNASKVCIFCAGKYGKKLLYEFRKRELEVDFFSDNNERVWDTIIEGLDCVSPISLDRQHTLILVALENPDELTLELKKRGFKWVIPYYEIINDILQIAPIVLPD